MITLRLKPKIGRRVERGHLWVFSNEVDSISGELEPGGELGVVDAKGRFVGMALFSASSLIRARIYSRVKGEKCDAEFIRKRLEQALAYRRSIGALGHSYRLVHSESDGLPGAMIDVFGDHVVLQILTMSMDVRRDALRDAVVEVLKPAAIIERSESPARELEGLGANSGTLHGSPENPVRIEENGVALYADLAGGQKTGYYLDQVRNRALAMPLMAGRRVLDLFSYVGSWSVAAAAHGAESVIGVDSSAAALELARRSSNENERAHGRCEYVEQDVFQFLRAEVNEKRKYGAIVLDPPPLAKSRRDVQNALRAYRELNLRAMQLLDDGGILISCSCSHHVSIDDLKTTLTLAAKDAHSDFSILYETMQSPDHPIHLSTPETGYLKAIFLSKRSF